MTDVCSGRTARTHTGRRNWVRAVSALVPTCCLSVGAVFSVTLLGPVAPAGADQVSTLQAQAAQLTREMTLEALQVDADQQQSQQAQAQAAQDQAALAQTEANIALSLQRMSKAQSTLAQSAVNAYVDAGGTATGTPFASPSNSDGAVYEQVVTGNLGGALAHLHSVRKSLQAQEATQQQLTAADAQEESKASALLSAAQHTEASLQSQASQIDAQLASAISAQQAATAAAAQAKRAAAAATAAATPRSTVHAATTAPTAPSAAASVTAGPLPPFLACVLQVESGGDYQAVSPTGGYLGGFQFSQSTWDHAAELAGLPTLVGVPPNDASPSDQNALAIALYNADGEQPWLDGCG